MGSFARLASFPLLFLCVSCCASTASWCALQAGELDPSFDPSQFVLQSVYAFAVQPDGAVLVGASSLTPTNRITRSSGFTASVTGGTGVRAVVLQPNGKVIIGGDFTGVNGRSRSCVARLNSDGTLDESFGDPAVSNSSVVFALALQPDGKILVGGSFGSVGLLARNSVARLNADGTLDTAFQYDGTGADGEIHAIVLQPDGKVLIGGAFRNVMGVSRPGLTRLNADGTLDAGFATPFLGTNGVVHALARQPDAKILVGGDFTLVDGMPRNRIARLESNGTVDMSFQSLTGPDNHVRALVLQAEGKIVIAGAFTTFDDVPRSRVARLNANGTLDTAYAAGLDGFDNEVRALALDLQGRTLAGGDFDVPAFRRAALGATNGDFASYPWLTLLGGGCGGVSALQADGKFLQACSTQAGYQILRMNPDGSVDPTFEAKVTGGTGLPPLVTAIAVQPDGRVLIAGSFRFVNEFQRRCVGRVNSDGSIDTKFDDPRVNRSNQVLVNALALQPDGKIVIGGLFSSIGGIPARNIGRLGSDGKPDTSFTAEYGGTYVSALVLQPDRKILVATPDLYRLNVDGSLDEGFEPPAGVGLLLALKRNGYILSRTQENHIVRLKANGHVDPDFRGTEIGDVRAIRLQNDERLLVASGSSASVIARLNDDGSADRSFRRGLTSGPGSRDMFVIQDDGNILVSGRPLAYNGVSRHDVARLIGNTPAGDDPDDDGVPTATDNCPFWFNSSQGDNDADGEGDACDTDDGLIWEWRDDRASISYQLETSVSSWNVYSGDLDVLRETGEYSQRSGANLLANRHCGETTIRATDPGMPLSGDVSFSLVAAVTSEGEGTLGSSTAGPRPNSHPCP